MSGKWCRLDEVEYPDWPGDYCPKHSSIELVAAPAPVEPPRDEAADGALPARCWNCGARSTHADNDVCALCHEPLAPVLVIDFPAGSVVLRERQASALLGRAGEHGRLFAGYPNVSRRHASVSVDEAGDAWITPILQAPNGTFVNDREILARTAIGPADRIRLATDQPPRPGPVSERIRQPFRER